MDIAFLLTNAIVVASIYGLIAIAVSITWSSLGLINLGYGFIFSVAGYAAWLVAANVSHNPVPDRRRRHPGRCARQAS